jgi:AAA family ATP:ADP antiporter
MTNPAPPPASLAFRTLSRFVRVEREEVAPLLLGILFYFFVLAGYYILRPIRETFGITRGTDDLPALFYGTVAVMVMINPVYSRLVATLPRSQFIPLVYRGLIVCLLVFFVCLETLEGDTLLGLKYAFYIFISVLNLFIVSIFWSLMSDLFDREKAGRLFGCLAVGGSLGAIVGLLITRSAVAQIGHGNLMLVSCLFFECAVRCALSFNRRFAAPQQARVAESTRKLTGRPDEPLGGSAWAGLLAVTRSPYLLGIGAYLLLYGVSGTFAYFFQQGIVSEAAPDDTTRTHIFANLDLFTNLATLTLQAFVFAHLLRWLGPATLLCLLPVYSAIGFLLLSSGWIPQGSLLLVFSVFQVLRRAIGYGLKKPAQELLFTAVSPEDKYKAKNLIDLTFARTGDMLGAGASDQLQGAGLGLLALAGAAAPVSLLWMVVGLALGLAYKKRSAALALPAQKA